jgi:CheY-like chemotaxis protein
LYLPAAVRAGALSDPKLESALTEAGHTLRSVSSKEELSDALRTGQYDVLLTDFADAPDLQKIITAAPTNPIVIPAVYLLESTNQQQLKADTARAAKEFSLVVQVPGRPGHYCAAVDKAMELKLKRDRS